MSISAEDDSALRWAHPTTFFFLVPSAKQGSSLPAKLVSGRGAPTFWFVFRAISGCIFFFGCVELRGVHEEHDDRDDGQSAAKRKLDGLEGVAEKGLVDQQAIDEANQTHDAAMEWVQVLIVVGD